MCFLVITSSISNGQLLYDSNDLKIEQLTENTYRHISYLPTKEWGRVSCNGMIVIHQNEAIIADAPTRPEDAENLIQWIEDSMHANIKAVIVTHFHEDCLGGLAAFHNRSIPSYANEQTVSFAERDSVVRPKHGFSDMMEIPVGNQKVIISYHGAGHTYDNIVCYFPSEKVLFGGCLLKCMKAGKGYLGDADVHEWPKTVKKVAQAYPEAEVIIPGHGKSGNRSLFDYTINLFVPGE